MSDCAGCPALLGKAKPAYRDDDHIVDAYEVAAYTDDANTGDRERRGSRFYQIGKIASLFRNRPKAALPNQRSALHEIPAPRSRNTAFYEA